MMLNLSKLLKMFEEILKYKSQSESRRSSNGRSQIRTVSELFELETRKFRKWTVTRVGGDDSELNGIFFALKLDLETDKMTGLLTVKWTVKDLVIV